MNIKLILKEIAKRNIISYLSLISRMIWRLIELNSKIFTNKKNRKSKCFQEYNINIEVEEVQSLKSKIIIKFINENNCTALDDKAELTKQVSNYFEQLCLEEAVVHPHPQKLFSLEKENKKMCITPEQISFFFGHGKPSKFKVCEDSRLGLEIVHPKETYFDKNEYENNKNKNDESTLLSDLLKKRHFQIKQHNLLVYMQPSVELWHPVSIDDIPWAWLKEEKWRLHTFAKYPQVSAKSALLLAADGFAYIGVGRGLDDNVICYFCCATKSNWRPTDVISNVHKQLSPQCPMAAGINCDNVPMTCPNGGSALFNKIYGQQRSSSTVVGSPKQKNGNEIETDSISQVNHDTNRRDMASAPSNNLTSGRIFANNSISRPPLQQQAHAEHHDADVTTSHQPLENDAPSSTVTSSNLTAWQPFESNNDIRFQQPVRQSANGNNRPVASPSALTASSTSGSPDQTNSTNRRTGLRSSNPNPSIPQTGNGANNPQSQTTDAPSNTNSTGSQVSGSCTKPEGPTYAQLGIITERPKRYEYAVITKRLETFEHWPRDHHLKKEDLSEAGFYYAGYGDCARCFYCGGGLRNWEAEDDVWVEHARWFPKCAFIRQQMGQVFVDTVQELNKDYDQIPFAMVSNKIGKPASVFHLDSKDTPLKRDAAVRTVVEMGFDLKDVISAAEAIKDEGDFMFKDKFSGSASILSADRIYEKLLQENRSRSANVQHSSQGIGSTDDVAKNLETMRTLKEQNNQLRQQTVCKICMDKEVAVVFLPCGHLVSCSDCAAAMKDCPVCRNSVKGVVRAFMG